MTDFPAPVSRRRPGSQHVQATRTTPLTENRPDADIADNTTPVKLRELERGWRARRRQALQDMSNNVTHDTPLAVPVQIKKSAGRHSMKSANEASVSLPRPVAGPSRPRLTTNNRTVTRRVSWVGSEQPQKVTGAYPQTALHAQVATTQRPPELLPPTPPQSPPPRPKQDRVRREQASNRAAGCFLRPILAAPLPPTPSPVHLLRHASDSITVHASGGRYELSLSFDSGKKVVHILSGGEEIHWQSGTERPTSMSLQDEYKWSVREKSKWQAVQEVVNRFKRKTPRVKIYHSLGQLTVTCSDPPDIILDSHLLDRLSWPASRQLASPKSRVKVVYSRLEQTLTFDSETLCQPDPSSRMKSERLRAKRVLQLADTVHAIHLTPGEDWSNGEKEALRRLWSLAEEWERY